MSSSNSFTKSPSGERTKNKTPKGSNSHSQKKILDDVPKSPSFVVKPLNKSSIPKQKWTKQSPPSGRRKLEFEEDMMIAKVTASDPKLQSDLLRKAKDKRRDLERQKKDGKRVPYWRPQSGSAPVEIAHSQQVECQDLDSYVLNPEPQMAWPDIGATISIDEATSIVVGEAVNSINTVGSSLSSLTEVVREFHNTVVGNDGKVKIEHISPAIDSLTKSVVDMSEFAVLIIVVVLIVLLKPKTSVERGLAFAAVAGILMSRLSLKDLMEKSGLLGWFQSSPVPQTGIDFDSSIEDITTMVTAFVNLYVAAHFGKELLDPKEFLKITTQLSRATPTVANVTRGIHLIVDFISRAAGKMLHGDDFVSTGHQFIDKFFTDTKEVCELWASKELYNRASSVDRVKGLISFGEDILKKMPASGKYANLKMMTFSAIVDLKKIRDALLSSSFKFSGVRHEPATLLLRGEPGVFKSQAMQHVGNAVCARTLSPDDYARYMESPTATVYNRQFENVYWDGFTSDKKIIFFDDALQCKDVAGNPDNEVMNIIRAINIFENILHMAGMENKGNTHCRPDFVIANTNMMTYNIESIHAQAAFTRRWDIVVDVVPKREFSIDPTLDGPQRKFDYKKIPVWKKEECEGREHLIGITRTHPDMCEFQLQRLSPDGRQFEPSGEKSLSFEELVDQLVETFELKQARHKGYLATLDDTLRRERAKYEAKIKPQSGQLDVSLLSLVEENLMETYYRDRITFYASVLVFDAAYHGLFQAFDVPLNVVRLRVGRYGTSQVQFDEVAGLRYAQTYETVVHTSVWSLIHCLKSAFAFTRCDNEWEGFNVLFSFIEEYFDAFMCEELDILNGDEIPSMQLNDLLQLFYFTAYCFERSFGEFIHPHTTVVSILYEGLSLQASIELKRHVLVEPQVDLELGSASTLNLEDMEDTKEYHLSTKNQRALDFFKLANYKKYSLLENILRATIYENELTETIMTPDEVFEALLSFDLEELTPDDIDGDITSLVAKVKTRVKSRGKRKTSEVPIAEVQGILTTAKSSASHFTKMLYDFYVKCVLYIVSIGSELGDSGLKWAIEDETTRKNFGILTASLLSGYAAFKTASGVINMVFGAFSGQSNERSGKISRSRNRTKLNRNPRPVPHSLQSDNRNLVSVIEMIANNNLFVLTRPREKSEREIGDRLVMGYALAVKGSFLLMPYHFYSSLCSLRDADEYDGDDLLHLRLTHNGVLSFSLTVDEFIDGFVYWSEGDKQDVCLVKMPRRYQPVRSIVKHFATEKQQQNYTNCDVTLYIGNKKRVSGDTSEKFLPEIHCTHAVRDSNMEIPENEIWEGYTVKEVYKYRSSTNNGDCGSPLFVDDKQKTATILGIHVAGISERKLGFSSMITREWLEKYLEIAGDDYQVEDIEQQFGIVLEPVGPPVGNMQNLGSITPQSMVPGRMMGTAIRQSPLHNTYFQSPNAPARLRPFELEGVLVDPFDVAANGYCPGDLYIPDNDLAQAKKSLSDYLMRNSTQGIQKRIMTFQEAVLGDEPGSAFSSLPRGTSSGFPYNVLNKPSSKIYFFGDKMDFDLDNPHAEELKMEVLRVERLLKQGIRSNHVFTDSLKDETRKLAKVKSGKTRMFSGSPLVYLILSRMYFGSFSKWMIENRITNGIAIGVNEFSSEWQLAAELLNEKGVGRNKGAGDFEGLDKRELPVFHQYLCDLVNEWYDGSAVESRVRWLLIQDLTNSLHVNRGVLTHWRGAMPSGHFLTALFNSLTVALQFRLCWKWAIEDRFKGSHDFNKFVYLLVLGDDNVFSVDPKYVVHFNEKVLGELMPKLGQIYTSADKESELSEELHALEDVTFLKRKWRFCPEAGRFVAPLELNSILDIGNWVKKGGNHVGDTEKNIEVMLHELSFWGREIYDYWCERICSAIDKCPGMRRPESTSYIRMLNEVLERDGNYWGMRLETDYSSSLVPIEELQHAGYHTEGDNSPVIQPQSGGFVLSKGAGLFRLTSRIARWQPHQYPGTRRTAKGLAQSTLLIGAATKQTVGEDGVTNVSHIEEGGSSDVAKNTTTSTDDAGVVVAKMPYVPLSRDILDSVRTGVSNEIASFLAKPKIVASGVLSTTDSFTSLLVSHMVPSTYINGGSGDIWQSKLTGTLAFRGELHLTLQVNGNRFQQGRYILGFCPVGGATVNAVNTNQQAFIRAHMCSLTEVTQLPHVELDVNCDTEASLSIPTVNAQGWCAIKMGAAYGDIGMVFLVPYSPLVAPTGSSSCTYTLFAHYEKVEIAMPTMPQSGRVKTRVRRNPRKVSEVEQESVGIGPLEALATSVGTVAGSLSHVPVLSSVATQVGWVADIVKKSAASFGWSRPKNDGPALYMSKQVMHRLTNVDVPDNATKMAYFDRNELEDMPSFAGTGVDEMSLNYVAGISSYIQTVSWLTSQAIDSNLVFLNVHPRNFIRTTTQATQTVTHLSPIAWVASFFSMWRGTIRFTFKLVKTEFHSGRLLVCFVPSEYNLGSPAAVAMNNTAFLHRSIIDVRLGNEFTIDIPYVSFSQYRSTYGADAATGSLYVKILNPLTAPANVSSSVTILIETSAGPDFEVAMPCNPSGQPVFQWTPQMGRNDCSIVEESVGSASSFDSHAPARLCIGEKMLSFRSLLKRFSLVLKTAAFPTSTNRYINFYPHSISISVLDSTPTYRSNNFDADLIDRIAPCYALMRGSVRWKFVCPEKASDYHMFVYGYPRTNATYSVDTLSPYTVGWGDLRGVNRNVAFSRGDATGGLEVEFPYYAPFVSCATADLISCGAVSGANTINLCGTGSTTPKQLASVQILDSSAANLPMPLTYRAAGEDFSLGMFVSTLPVVGYDMTYAS